jgi:hypothetical protein
MPHNSAYAHCRAQGYAIQKNHLVLPCKGSAPPVGATLNACGVPYHTQGSSAHVKTQYLLTVRKRSRQQFGYRRDGHARIQNIRRVRVVGFCLPDSAMARAWLRVIRTAAGVSMLSLRRGVPVKIAKLSMCLY